MGTQDAPAAFMTLENLQFSFRPSLTREQINLLHELGFLGRKENPSRCDRNSSWLSSPSG